MSLLTLVFALSLAPLEQKGLDHLYNLEFAEAKEIFERLSEELPDSPVGPHYLSTVLWMEELNQRGAMAGQTFQSSRYWTRKRREPPAPALVASFEHWTEEALARAKQQLNEQANDLEALYFLGATESIVSAFQATVARKYFSAYRAGRRARGHHKRLLKLEPSYTDAYLVPGVYEYTTATLPRSLKVLAFLIGVRGSKEKGIELVRKTAREGVRARWGAKLMLIVALEREKKYSSALSLLKELEAAFPKNPLYPLERGWVHLLRKDWARARSIFEAIRAKQHLEVPHYNRLAEARVLLHLGESFLLDGKADEALAYFSETIEEPSCTSSTRALALLRRGQAHDLLGDRDRALADYRATIRLDEDKTTRRLAKRHLKKPFRLSR